MPLSSAVAHALLAAKLGDLRGVVGEVGELVHDRVGLETRDRGAQSLEVVEP
jgi:hypothetical protein